MLHSFKLKHSRLNNINKLINKYIPSRKEVSIIKKLFFIIAGLIILTSCTDAKIVVPIHEYAELPAEEIGEELGEETIEEKEEEIEHEKNVPERPNQSFNVYSEAGVVGGLRVGVCWKESVEEDCAFTPENPREETMSKNRLFANKGEELHISMTQNNEDFKVGIKPHQVEVIQFGFRDDEGKVIDSETVENQTFFSAPDEQGNYYYLIHVIWDEGKTKRAYYAFRIRVS
ncbi:hypothetical protein [Ornithinibacillus halophilus]|uniref:Uncharacterized protein n=1 Tax=Ornithinibacillus halophilus TaxID=930117 RepID=A0A1M5IP35_9BACI|nr:hypothetical protein [Ornithinibacillus halophilus]SHG30072.1 hypothetical protein SAMN05216225_102522 [Ornithinibacillus halophilus]